MTDIRTFLYSGAFSSFEEGITTSETNGLVKKALVAVEGNFKDSKGIEHSFTPERLAIIAEHTNRALNSGIDIPVCTDHQKSVQSTVGTFGEGAEVFTKVITEEDLPNKKAKHLLGKVGLFVNNVVLSVPEVIEKVKNKVITSVSMGLNLSKDDHRIMELSLVPIPAIPNMGLFSVTNNSQALTWDDLEKNEQSIENLKEDYQKLSDQLWTIISNIYTDESVDITSIDILKQYIYTALNGFSVRVLDVLGLSDNTSSADTSTEEISGENADVAQSMAATQRQDIASASANPGNVTYSRAPKYQRAEFAITNNRTRYYKKSNKRNYGISTSNFQANQASPEIEQVPLGLYKLQNEYFKHKGITITPKNYKKHRKTMDLIAKEYYRRFPEYHPSVTQYQVVPGNQLNNYL